MLYIDDATCGKMRVVEARTELAPADSGTGNDCMEDLEVTATMLGGALNTAIDVDELIATVVLLAGERTGLDTRTLDEACNIDDVTPAAAEKGRTGCVDDTAAVCCTVDWDTEECTAVELATWLVTTELAAIAIINSSGGGARARGG